MNDTTPPGDPFAILAGTLCLMSCPRAGVAPLFVRSIVANLERLAAHPSISAEMRSVCRRLAVQWEERLAETGEGHVSPPAH